MGPRVKATHHTFRHVSLYKLIQSHEIKGKCKEGPLEDAQKSRKDPTPSLAIHRDFYCVKNTKVTEYQLFSNMEKGCKEAERKEGI